MAYGIADVKRNLRAAETKQLQSGYTVDRNKRKLMLRTAQQAFQRALTIARGLPPQPEKEDLRKRAETGFAACKRRMNKMALDERKERAAKALIQREEEQADDDAQGEKGDTAAQEAPESAEKADAPSPPPVEPTE